MSPNEAPEATRWPARLSAAVLLPVTAQGRQESVRGDGLWGDYLLTNEDWREESRKRVG
jgi:hypothetical protein